MAQQALLNTANDKNNVISELRAELKMKSFELTTLGVSFEVRFYVFRIFIVKVRAYTNLLNLNFFYHSFCFSISLQERMGQLRANELEVDVLRQEVSAHK